MSELEIAVMQFIDSLETGAPESEALTYFGEECKPTLDGLMGDGYIGRKWADGDGVESMHVEGINFPIVLGPSGNYFLTDTGLAYLKNCQIVADKATLPSMF